MDMARGSITKDHGTTKLLGVLFMTSGVKETATDPRFKVINKDAIARPELVDEEMTLVIKTFGSDSGGIRTTTSLLPILTGSAAGWFQGFGVVKAEGKIV
jgi:hypothetical protein